MKPRFYGRSASPSDCVPGRCAAGRPGFSMVELLTVIAIIAILAAIIFPVFATVRKNVYKAQCTSNLHAIAQALKLYKDDWKVYPNALFGYYNPESQSPNKIQTFLYPQYIKDANAFKCPLSPVRVVELDPSRTQLVPAVHPVTVKDPISGQGWPYRYFPWDSYDGTFVPHNSPNSSYQLHYVRKVTGGGPSFGDDPRQLIYRNPPDNTVVTWCTYHRDYSGQAPAQGSIDLVLFLDGTVKPIPSNEMVATPDDPVRPYRATK
jgi:prepilin-type N-terminal cleavage/methylation domain-containing protein